jgi:hypothetical protein
MVPEPTDPLLNVWRMQWNGRAFLSGPQAIAKLFDTNIFYPFPLTLAYSEHFLMMSAEALPFLLLADSHLVGMNLRALMTFVLSGYGMYLCVTAWSGNRQAGLLAGILYAFSPYRLGQLNHLELLVTEWMPLTLLALHWTLTRPSLRYAILFGLFFNLQALSGFHYGLNLTIACALLATVYTVTGRVCWRRGLWGAAALSILATLALNWPIWRVYLRFSDVMGAVRTPGEVRVYSAALTDYFTAIPYNLLYGWTFGYWSSADRQFQPLMPFGVVGLLLTLIALLMCGYALLFRHRRAKSPTPQQVTKLPVLSSLLSPLHLPLSYLFSTITFSLLLIVCGILLSFGLNENALGAGLASALKYSPYVWLYDHVTFFQGIRVPGRYGILTVLGLVSLAGWGAAALLQSAGRQSKRLESSVVTVLAAFILLESWSAPLVGPEFPAGENIPLVYRWLKEQTTPDAVVLELPFQGSSEFVYEYYSSYHWRRLANGGSGFTPPIYKALRQWLQTFPDPRSMDIIQQLGIDYVILHQDSYPSEAWQRILDDLPRYWPAIEQIHQLDEALVLSIATPSVAGAPACRTEAERIRVTLAPAELDGLSNAVAVTYHNPGPAAFVADVTRVSALSFGNDSQKYFTEPLVTPAGESQSVIIPLRAGQSSADLTAASLATLNRRVSASGDQPALLLPDMKLAAQQQQPLGLKFAGGAELVAFALAPAKATACNHLTIALKWTEGQAGDTALVQLLDPFGRVIVEDEAHPWRDNSREQLDARSIPLNGALPAGRYGLRVRVKTADGQERSPITAAGVTIPSDQIPPLPLIIHPGPHSLGVDPPALAGASSLDGATSPVMFEGGIKLLGADTPQHQVRPGDWLRFSLLWQVERPIETDLTVFTQLLGPDGRIWGQRDNRPGGGWYDMSLWQPNQPALDDYAFQIQAETPPGTYHLITGLYYTPTLTRVPLTGGGDFVEVALIQVDDTVEYE